MNFTGVFLQGNICGGMFSSRKFNMFHNWVVLENCEIHNLFLVQANFSSTYSLYNQIRTQLANCATKWASLRFGSCRAETLSPFKIYMARFTNIPNHINSSFTFLNICHHFYPLLNDHCKLILKTKGISSDGRAIALHVRRTGIDIRILQTFFRHTVHYLSSC